MEQCGRVLVSTCCFDCHGMVMCPTTNQILNSMAVGYSFYIKRLFFLCIVLPIFIVVKGIKNFVFGYKKLRDEFAAKQEEFHKVVFDAIPVEEKKQEMVKAGDIELNTVCFGNQEDPLMVLVHGFPSCWASWEKMIPALVEGGNFVVAFDMRGYGMSDKPKGVDAYKMENLTNDVKVIIEKYCKEGEKAVLVGHDWGAAVSWMYAMYYPDTLSQLVIHNGPHPVTFAKTLKNSREQLFRSWYMFFFQLPILPEFLVAGGTPEEMIGDMKKSTYVKNAFSDDECNLTLAGWLQPNAMTGQMNYYRAAIRGHSKMKAKILNMPVLLLWGRKDPHLLESMNDTLSKKWVPNLQYVPIEKVGHFTPEEAPETCTEEILNFLGTTG
eukprot:TRINITY_DN1694_c0_g2_i1.p1 TRINITY_DN1694_c0_g2~~TRINITY_DN1694_c0_g2_i1.p1  ORF type:complete len:381 (+),score=140.15 TRINITY_DN1694_c0_g2_i1:168-1310(+)